MASSSSQQQAPALAAYNMKNPAVKRIHKEIAELQAESSAQYAAAPLEDNLFEWHFTVRGPEGTEFEGGKYHGRILLPPEYPFKPPSIMLLTPNGRFEVGKKICLSITGFHPEHWQPAWGIRTVLLAIISFMPTKGNGAIGALDHTEDERRIFAKKSCHWKCDICQDGAKLIFPAALAEETDSNRAKLDDIKREISEAGITFAYEKKPSDTKQPTSAQPEASSSSTSFSPSSQSASETAYATSTVSEKNISISNNSAANPTPDTPTQPYFETFSRTSAIDSATSSTETSAAGPSMKLESSQAIEQSPPATSASSVLPSSPSSSSSYPGPESAPQPQPQPQSQQPLPQQQQRQQEPQEQQPSPSQPATQQQQQQQLPQLPNQPPQPARNHVHAHHHHAGVDEINDDDLHAPGAGVRGVEFGFHFHVELGLPWGANQRWPSHWVLDVLISALMALIVTLIARKFGFI